MAIGTVTHVNPRNGMFIIAIDSGDYVAFQNLSSTEVNVGDRIRGDLDALGGELGLDVGGQRRHCRVPSCEE